MKDDSESMGAKVGIRADVREATWGHKWSRDQWEGGDPSDRMLSNL